MATPIYCLECLQQLTTREELPADNNNVQINCTNCGLGQMFDTTQTYPLQEPA
jgi:transcription elongation factor Elf1